MKAKNKSKSKAATNKKPHYVSMEDRAADGYVALAQAIIATAVQDYKRVTKKIVAGKFAPRHEAEYHSCVAFFMRRCNGLVSIDGQVILRKLNEDLGIDTCVIQAALQKRADSKERIEDETQAQTENPGGNQTGADVESHTG